ncbi:MAG TPA: hypothetical protein VGB54_09505 [Allosphingosinicella sp.]|jgi:hypothetical protein
MADHIYAADGTSLGFRLSHYIYDLEGTPIGRVFAEKAYRFDGSYVGAMINSMVVDKPQVSRRSIKTLAPPPAVPMRRAESRRPIGQDHADCFDRLLAAET